MIFALVSLPLALSAIVFFINHRYDGVMLWDVKTIPGESAGTGMTSCDMFVRIDTRTPSFLIPTSSFTPPD